MALSKAEDKNIIVTEGENLFNFSLASNSTASLLNLYQALQYMFRILDVQVCLLYKEYRT